MAGTTPKARTIGAALRKAREAAGMGVRQLAEVLETSHATVSRWEAGQRSPRPEEVAAYLAKVDASAELREQIVELSRDPDGSHWLSVGIGLGSTQMVLLALTIVVSVLTVVPGRATRLQAVSTSSCSQRSYSSPSVPNHRRPNSKPGRCSKQSESVSTD